MTNTENNLDDIPLISEEDIGHLYDFVKDEPYTDWEDKEWLHGRIHPLHHLKCAIKYLIEAKREFEANKAFYSGEDDNIAEEEHVSIKFATRSNERWQPDTFISEYLQSIHALMYPSSKYEVRNGIVVEETTCYPLDLYNYFLRIFNDFLHDLSYFARLCRLDVLFDDFLELYNKVRLRLLKGSLQAGNELSPEERALLERLYYESNESSFLIMQYEMLLDRLYKEGKIVVPEKEIKAFRDKESKEVRRQQMDELVKWAQEEWSKENGHTDQYMMRKILEKYPPKSGYTSEASFRGAFINYKKEHKWKREDDKRPRTRGYKNG